MTFGREVHNPAWPLQFANRRHVNLARLHFASLAGSQVQTVILREALFEHQRDTFTHHADGIYRVDQGFGFGFQKVALGKTDHWKYHPGRAWTGSARPLAATSCSMRSFIASV
ncbi:hypothetical protein D3C76_1108110 [compost metagenome]